MTIQIRNDELVNLLSADLQRRYEPNFAWKSAVSAHQALPGLRGFWPMSAWTSVGGVVQANDLAGQGYHLTRTNARASSGPYGAGLAPAAYFDGAGDWLLRADGGAAQWADILGTEGYVLPVSLRGLTMGCWTVTERLTSFDGLMCKSSAAAIANDSYAIYFRGDVAGDPFEFFISSGAASVTVTGSAGTATGTWYHVVGRFQPGASVDIWQNGVKTTQATAIASIVDSTDDFVIGALSSTNNVYNGYVSMAFLCAMALPDSQIQALFQQTRALFGI